MTLNASNFMLLKKQSIARYRIFKGALSTFKDFYHALLATIRSCDNSSYVYIEPIFYSAQTDSQNGNI